MRLYKEVGTLVIIAALVLLGTSTFLLFGKLVYAIMCLFV